MAASLSHDFATPDGCLQYLQRRAPDLYQLQAMQWNFLAFFGRTSSGKSSLMSYVGPDANICAIQPEAATATTQFVLGLRHKKYREVAGALERGEAGAFFRTHPLWDDDQGGALCGDARRAAAASVPVMNAQERWPAPAPSAFTRTHDPGRYGTLYVSGRHLEHVFRRVVPRMHHGVFPKSGAGEYVVYDIDRVTADPKLAALLARTVLIDTKGLDTPEPSPHGVAVLRLATRAVYLMPSAHQQNRDAAKAFEAMMGESVYGTAWQVKYGTLLSRMGQALLRGCEPTFLTSAGTEALKMAEDRSAAPAGAGDQGDAALNDLWAKAVFVRGRLDESVRMRKGYEQAVQDAGAALGQFVCDPVGQRVRHVAVPAYAQPSAALDEHNDIAPLREELLEPAHEPKRQHRSLCEVLWAYEMDARERMAKSRRAGWAACAPWWAANTEGYYASEMLKKMKCVREAAHEAAGA